MRFTRPMLSLSLFLLAAAAVAQPKDLAKTGTATPPTLRASTNTALSYTGGVPPAFTGSLDAADSTYNRGVSCTSLSGVGTAVAFDTLTITNNAPGTANLVVFSTQVGGTPCPAASGPDTFFTLYDTTFNPATPLANCLAVNDDINGATDRCSKLTFSMPVSSVRVIALSAFDNASLATGLFNYQVNFTGSSPVELMEFQID